MKADVEDDLAEEANPVDVLLNAASEEERWDPVQGSQGKRRPALHDDEEDEDGLPQGALLVEAGVRAAEYDQMLESDKADPETGTEDAADEATDEATDEEAGVITEDAKDANEISEADAERLEEDE